jgi:TonB family protein
MRIRAAIKRIGKIACRHLWILFFAGLGFAQDTEARPADVGLIAQVRITAVNVFPNRVVIMGEANLALTPAIKAVIFKDLPAFIDQSSFHVMSDDRAFIKILSIDFLDQATESAPLPRTKKLRTAVAHIDVAKGGSFLMFLSYSTWTDIRAARYYIQALAGSSELKLEMSEEASRGSDDPEAPIRAVGEIRPPRLIKKVFPVYPKAARQARVEGIVIFEIMTDIYGRVQETRVLRSVQLLDQAAVDAVRQWRYEPLIINGRPRDAIFTATVRFELKNDVISAFRNLSELWRRFCRATTSLKILNGGWVVDQREGEIR